MKSNRTNLLIFAARGLLLAAAVVAAYLGYASLGGSVAGCGDSASCSSLLSGTWSKAFGVPVAFAGLVTYLGLVALAGPFARRRSGAAVTIASVLMLLIPAVALWFVGLQLFSLRAVCPWCCLAHGLATAGVITLFVARFAERRHFTQAPAAASSMAVIPAAASLLFVSFIAVVGLTQADRPGVVTGQLGSPIKRSHTIDSKGVQRVGEGLELGKVTIWPSELPGFGNAASDKVVVLIGDFTCEHCRATHAILDQVSQVFGDQLGVILLPATRGDESAMIQRVALALHRENPELYRALSKSIGSGLVADNSSSVINEATRLIGIERLSAAMQKHSSWIDDQLATTAAVRDANAKATGRRTLPQLMIGDEVVFGAHPSPGYYVNLLQQNFELRQVAVVESVVGTGSGDERPVLELKSQEVSVGEVQPGQTVEVSVPFENTGEGTLVLGWIKTPPGVEVMFLPGGEIEPGGKDSLAFHLSVPADAAVPTLIDKTLVVHSNAHLEGVALRLIGAVSTGTGEVRQANASDGEPK